MLLIDQAIEDAAVVLAEHEPIDHQREARRKRKVFGVRESLIIFKRDGYQCVECRSDDDLTVDHIFPWSLGGSDDHDNLQTLCGSCNSAKKDRI